MIRTVQRAIWLGLFVVVVNPLRVSAQQDQPSQPVPDQSSVPQSGPIPAYRSPLASISGNDNDSDAGDESQELAPDTRSLSGAQNLSLGIPTGPSYWQPHIDVAATADSNALETANSAGWGEWTSISGGVDVHKLSGANSMTLSYTSGGMFTNYSGVTNGVVQALSFSDKFAFRRSSVMFVDNLNYLPESAFGFAGIGGAAIPGSSASGLGSAFTSGQSLLTGYGQNLGNSFAAELDTFLTPRTSLTVVSGYSLLRYFDGDLFNYGDVTFRGGYNYQVDRKDTIAVLYTFSGIGYTNFDQSIDDHTVQVSYGRRVTGHLAFQVAAGPQVVISRIPITGNGASAGSGSPVGTNVTQVLLSLNTAIQWQPNRTSLALAYNHAANGGSGLLAGSVADIVTGSLSRQVSRTFSDAFTVGYSRNEGVAVTKTATSSQTYDYWFAGISVTHPISRVTGLTFSYQFQYQNSNATFCSGPTCGTDVLRNMISIAIGWHQRPLLF